MDHFVRQFIEHCPQQNNWIVLSNFHKIISHSDRIVQKSNGLSSDLLPEHGNLLHVAFNYITASPSAKMLAVVYLQIDDQINWWLIDNGEEDQTIKSKLTVLNHLTDLETGGLIDKKTAKLLGLNRVKWTIPKSNNNNQTIGLTSFLQSQPGKERTNVLYNWIKQSGFVLNLAHNYLIQTTDFQPLPEFSQIKHVVFDQNCQFSDFSFLAKFPELKIFEIRQMPQINGKLLAEILQFAPNVEAFIMEYCSNLDISILWTLLKLKKIRLIKLNYPNLPDYYQAKNAQIIREHWKSCYSKTLEQLDVNSEHLTLEVLDYLVKGCPNLSDILVADSLLEKISHNVSFDHLSGQPLNFACSSEHNKGFKATRPIRFLNLNRNQYSEPFSESMLKIIEGGERLSP